MKLPDRATVRIAGRQFSAIVEPLENRQLLSVSPAIVMPTVTAVSLSGEPAVAAGTALPAKSMLTAVAFRFNVPVGIKLTALSLRNMTTGTTVAASSMRLSYDATTRTATWTFPAMVGGSLPDGVYRATLDDAQVTDASGRLLDGDRNGSAGGDFTVSVRRLFGDVDGNGAITPSDVFVFFGAYPTAKGDAKYQPRFDFNADGNTSDFDRTAAEQRYGTVLSELGTRAADTPVPVASTETAGPRAIVTNPGIKTITIQAKRRQVDAWSNYSVKTLPAGLTMAAPILSKYGGDTSQKFAAKGYFYTTKLNGKWWMVDPEGNRYVDNAVGVIGPRVFPDNAAEFTSKFGTGKAGNAKWATWIKNWLSEIGYKSAGCWGTPSIQNAAGQRTSYTILLDIMATFAMSIGWGSSGFGHANFRYGVIPVFDSRYSTFCSAFMSKVLPQVYPGLDLKSDRYLVAYMTDNELPWDTSTLDAYLALPSGDVNRTAVRNWLTARGRTTPTDQDRADFRTYVMETYLRLTTQAIRAYDPNHMIGCRFLGGDTKKPYVFKAAKKYLNVITFNYYLNMEPAAAIEASAAAADMPWICTDMYVKGVDSGMPNTTGYNYTVKTQADRGWYYQQMMLSVLGSKHGVGASWLCLQDNNMSNPEPTNQDANKGLMTVHYPLSHASNPYVALTNRIRDLNRNLYPLADWLNK
jgi:hypothetical protein